jgi:hypothetical protein
VRATAESADRVRIAVIDTGVGIAREQVERLFAEFQQTADGARKDADTKPRPENSESKLDPIPSDAELKTAQNLVHDVFSADLEKKTARSVPFVQFPSGRNTLVW